MQYLIRLTHKDEIVDISFFDNKEEALVYYQELINEGLPKDDYYTLGFYKLDLIMGSSRGSFPPNTVME